MENCTARRLLDIAEELLAELIHERDCFFNSCTIRGDESTADGEDIITLRQMDDLIDRAQAVIGQANSEIREATP